MSDQDFFFDEDEQPKTEETKAPAKKGDSAKTSGAAAPAVGAQSVSMAVAGLIGVIALLGGVIIGILLPLGTANPGSPAATTLPSGVAPQPAPQLSPDQLQGDLPEGHPPIEEAPGGMPGGVPGAEGSEETTSN